MSEGVSNLVRFPVERRRAPELVSLKELQDRMGMSERFWRYRVAEGLPVRRWGTRLMFDPVVVDEWMQERYQQDGGQQRGA